MMDSHMLILFLGVVSLCIATTSSTCISHQDCSEEECPAGRVSRCADDGACECVPFLVGCDDATSDGDYALDPDVTDCSSFMRCLRNRDSTFKASKIPCQKPLVFDVRLKVCNWKYDGICPLLNEVPVEPVKPVEPVAPVAPAGKLVQTPKTDTDPCDLVDCQNHGTCVRDVGEPQGFRCDCLSGFGGRFCDDVCASINCHNGECVTAQTPAGFRCQCRAGWTGEACLTPQPAAASPTQAAASAAFCGFITCENGGICQVANNAQGWECKCALGYSGDFCQKSACDGFNCNNNGKCNIVGGVARCACNSGFGGPNCLTQATSTLTISPAAASHQLGTNVQFTCTTDFAAASYTWMLLRDGNFVAEVTGTTPSQTFPVVTLNQEGTFGYVCWAMPAGQMLISNTVSVNVVNVDPCQGVTCSFRGTCSVVAGRAKCTCNQGWTGDNCQTSSKGVCEIAGAITCQNGGVCENVIGGSGFRCKCPQGFSGLFCQNGAAVVGTPCIKAPMCATLQCPVGRAPFCSVPDFSCQCKASFLMPCATHGDCADKCPGGLGLCMQGGNCDCFTDIKNYYGSMVINKFPLSPPYIQQ